MKVIFDPPEDCQNGEDGHTEFMSRCEGCVRLANMVYRKRGPRGAFHKGHVVACNRLCGEPLARAQK
jgi:hypothetical protein